MRETCYRANEYCLQMNTLEGGKGIKMASAAISGAEVYGDLKYESGVHRVQRVPETESQGRVHTSAASVAVLPEADNVGASSTSICLFIEPANMLDKARITAYGVWFLWARQQLAYRLQSCILCLICGNCRSVLECPGFRHFILMQSCQNRCVL